jgi:hypothetical protein
MQWGRFPAPLLLLGCSGLKHPLINSAEGQTGCHRPMLGRWARSESRVAELRGPVYDPTRETRKKSELVEALALLFSHAAEGKLKDAKLAERLNGWIPSNLRTAA